jgi:hypothetical protein
VSLESDLTAIYSAYPRHKDKRYALLCIQRAIDRLMGGEAGRRMEYQEAVNFLRDRAARFAQSPAGQRGHMTPYPSTFFNRGAYMDDPLEWELITPQEEKQMRMQAEANVGVWRPL